MNNTCIERTFLFSSVSPAFLNVDTMAILPDTLEIYNSKIVSMHKKPTRYVRVSLPQRKVSFNNLAFYYTNVAGEEIKIENPTLMSPLDANENGEKASYLFDRFNSTGYQRDLNKDYIDIDLGSEYQISSVCCTPYIRSGLKNGDFFDLFYWNKGWQYLDTGEGSGAHLVFEHVPKGALLLLRNRNAREHPETRPFIYRNNEVLWH